MNAKAMPGCPDMPPPPMTGGQKAALSRFATINFPAFAKKYVVVNEKSMQKLYERRESLINQFVCAFYMHAGIESELSSIDFNNGGDSEIANKKEGFDVFVTKLVLSAMSYLPSYHSVAQNIILGGGDLQKGMVLNLLYVTSEDGRFMPSSLFELEVPKKYDSSRQISYTASNKDVFSFINPGITDLAFKKVSGALLPGKRYSVKTYQLLEDLDCMECLNFLANLNAILVGAQGLTLIMMTKEEFLFQGVWYVSLDKEESLLQDESVLPMYPVAKKNGQWHLDVESFHHKVKVGAQLICVTEIKK